jgi:hypothetical protein
MRVDCGSQNWRDRKIREWLLLLLRFAVTRDAADQAAVLASADELDSLGLRWRPGAPRFFLRTSGEVCAAILRVSDGHSDAVLRRHLARIDDPRLQRAFRAAVGFRQELEMPQQTFRISRSNGGDLWRGLARK